MVNHYTSTADFKASLGEVSESKKTILKYPRSVASNASLEEKLKCYNLSDEAIDVNRCNTYISYPMTLIYDISAYYNECVDNMLDIDARVILWNKYPTNKYELFYFLRINGWKLSSDNMMRSNHNNSPQESETMFFSHNLFNDKTYKIIRYNNYETIFDILFDLNKHANYVFLPNYWLTDYLNSYTVYYMDDTVNYIDYFKNSLEYNILYSEMPEQVNKYIDLVNIINHSIQFKNQYYGKNVSEIINKKINIRRYKDAY